MGVRSTQLQKLVNSYPEWSDVRKDEQSVGAQLFNPVALQLQDLFEQMQTIGKNYTISIANTQDMDLVSRFNLPKSFEFTLANADELHPEYTPPTVNGLMITPGVGVTSTFPITLAENNTIEGLWYLSIPNRYTSTILYNSSNPLPADNINLDDNTNSIPGLLLDGLLSEAPFIFSSTGLVVAEPRSKLWIHLSGGIQYLKQNEFGEAVRMLITITGETAKGLIESETISFIHDELQETMKEWAVIYKVEVSDVIPSTTRIRIFSSRFGKELSPPIPSYLDAYNTEESMYTKEQTDTFWNIDLDDPLLTMERYINESVTDRVSGFVDTEILRQFTLRDTTDSTDYQPIDLAVQPFSHHIWMIDENANLALFDDELPLPNMKVLEKKQPDAMSVLEPDRYHVALATDEIQMTYLWRRPITDIHRHRVYVIKPDNSKWLVKNGSLIPFVEDDWDFTKPSSRFLRPMDIFTLDQYGDWLWTLESRYINDVREIDQRILSREKKIAKLELDLSPLLGLDDIPYGIDFSSDQELIFCAKNTVLNEFYKYKINLFSDVMIIDYDQKVIFFKEQYDAVEVI